MTMSRKEVIFEWAKRQAERDGKPFPYLNFEEWHADAQSRRDELQRELSREHFWHEDSISEPETINYKFFDPYSKRLYCLFLSIGTLDEYWSITLCYKKEEDKEEEDDVWTFAYNPLPYGIYTYDELPLLKNEIIEVLRLHFPEVTGWNEGGVKETDLSEIDSDSTLYPPELTVYLEDTPKLYVAGNFKLLRRPPLFKQRVGIIGSRTPDEKGLEMAYLLGRYHSSEIVISGLARGIDTAAHKGCLDAGGQSIAVVGSGVDSVHPKENVELQRRIMDSDGLILSEQPEGTKANPRRLIARTRLQMAVADKIVVVECEKESGTMHAVNFAQQFRKPIFALECDWSGNRYLIDNEIAKPFRLQ